MRDILNKTALIELLNSKMSHPLFKEDKTMLSSLELPFYSDYMLLKAKTFSTMPSVEFSFLWNEKNDSIIKIDGERDCFFDNIELLKPHIDPKTAVAYVKFVLGNVWDDNGAIKVCEGIGDVEFYESPFPHQLAFLSENIKPAEVVDKGAEIEIKCNIVYGVALYGAVIELEKDGLFEIVDEWQIGDEIPALRTLFLE